MNQLKMSWTAALCMLIVSITCIDAFANDVLVNFEYNNAPKAYVKTLEIKKTGAYRVYMVGRHYKKITPELLNEGKLSANSVEDIKKVLENWNKSNVEGRYSSGINATDQPSYTFRFYEEDKPTMISISPSTSDKSFPTELKEDLDMLLGIFFKVLSD